MRYVSPFGPPCPLPPFQVRTDLRLSSVFICSSEVLMLLSDNFDYQSVARDLVPGVLSEQELGGMLHVHVLARVSGKGAAADRVSGASCACRAQELCTVECCLRAACRGTWSACPRCLPT